jgi:hypothetical protein
MVARRRLKRPPKRSAHLAPHRARVSLAEAAGVERVTPKVDKDVEQMRVEMKREDDRREEDHDAEEAAGGEDENEDGGDLDGGEEVSVGTSGGVGPVREVSSGARKVRGD